MPTLQELEVERQNRMRKLTEMLDKRQRYENYMHQQSETERQRLAQGRADTEKQWGNEAAKGAATGMSIGGPWGALAGGIAGTASGQNRAYKQRRKEGQSAMGAGLTTLFDIPGSLPSGQTPTGLAPAAAQGYAGYQDRTQGMPTEPTAMQEIQGLSQEEKQGVSDRYQAGLTETGGDPYADLWEFEESKKRKGRI